MHLPFLDIRAGKEWRPPHEHRILGTHNVEEFSKTQSQQKVRLLRV